MRSKLTLYHGSDHVVETPEYGRGRVANDYGQGFYCTESKDLAMEWAVSALHDGFANRYVLDAEYLNVLNLNSPEYSVLNWMAVLVAHRTFSLRTPVARRARRYLIDTFGVNVNAYDAVVGYRADDSYYDFAETFLNNGITVEQLALAMRLGKLGEQVVLKSRFAFSRLRFEGFVPASRDTFYPRRKARDEEASRAYLALLEREEDGLYVQDLMREGVSGDDARIPRNLSS